MDFPALILAASLCYRRPILWTDEAKQGPYDWLTARNGGLSPQP